VDRLNAAEARTRNRVNRVHDNVFSREIVTESFQHLSFFLIRAKHKLKIVFGVVMLVDQSF
jgi:hypothetical protein